MTVSAEERFGMCEVPDPAARTKREIDVLALALGQRPHNPRAQIAVIGEARPPWTAAAAATWPDSNGCGPCWPSKATVPIRPY